MVREPNLLHMYSLILQSRTKLLENFYPTMHTIQRNNTISTTTDLRYQIPLPPGQCCFLQMSKDQGCFRTHNNIAPKGKGGRSIARMLAKMVWECDIFSTVLSKIVDIRETANFDFPFPHASSYQAKSNLVLGDS